MQRVDQLIKRDHEYIRSMYDKAKQATGSDKQVYANEFIRALSVHSTAEEIVVYPAFEARLVSGRNAADHSRHEHLEIKYALHDLDRMNAQDARFDEQLDRVMSLVDRHMKQEENEFLPSLARSCYDTELEQLGNQFERIKPTLPTHPHPWAPDRGPLEVVAGMLQAPLDKLYDFALRTFPA